jgi:V/A-type H+-transporting ATPase subunit I
LGQLFGVSTTIIGFFSGTLFGLEMVNLPQFEALKHVFVSQDNMFFVALGIGFFQIIFGMCVQVYKQVKFFGWLYALNRIGWIIALPALIDVIGFKQFPQISLFVLIFGGALIVLFGSPKDGPLKSIGLGLADLYNVTGFAGDLLSYIRLFALGVSSAILGLVVNSIALSAKGVPYVGIILTILILVVGHSANLMLASLSAFVHPMRLTFVEFYKNVGFIGGGVPFKKFQKKYKSIKSKKE